MLKHNREEYPQSLSQYYLSKPHKFSYKKIVVASVPLFFLFCGLLIAFISLIGAIFCLIAVLVSLVWGYRHYYVNMQTHHRIISVFLHAFPNGSCHKQDILTAFEHRKFAELFGWFEQSLDNRYQYLWEDIKQQELDPLESDTSLLDEIFLDIGEEKGSDCYYCLLWCKRTFGQYQTPNIYGLAPVQVIKGDSYARLKQVLKLATKNPAIKRHKK